MPKVAATGALLNHGKLPEFGRFARLPTDQRECPILLRVVRCLPKPPACQPAADLSGQASDKPQGRKPREAGTRLRKSVVLWGFELCLLG